MITLIVIAYCLFAFVTSLPDIINLIGEMFFHIAIVVIAAVIFIRILMFFF